MLAYLINYLCSIIVLQLLQKYFFHNLAYKGLHSREVQSRQSKLRHIEFTTNFQMGLEGGSVRVEPVRIREDSTKHS